MSYAGVPLPSRPYGGQRKLGRAVGEPEWLAWAESCPGYQAGHGTWSPLWPERQNCPWLKRFVLGGLAVSPDRGCEVGGARPFPGALAAPGWVSGRLPPRLCVAVWVGSPPPRCQPTAGGLRGAVAACRAPPARLPGRVSRPKLPRPLPAAPAAAKRVPRVRSRRPPSPVTGRLIPRRPQEALPARLGGQGQAAAALRRPAAR